MNTGFKYDPSYGNGWLPYVNTEGQDPTYFVSLAQVALVSGVNLSIAATTNDKLIKITQVVLGPSVATAVGTQEIQARITNTPLTGGTPTGATIQQHDSNDPASTAVVQSWLGGVPGGGTVIATVRRGMLISQATTAPAGGNVLQWDFGTRPSKCPTIRPVAGNLQSFVIQSGAAPAGQLVDVYVEWIEKPNQ